MTLTYSAQEIVGTEYITVTNSTDSNCGLKTNFTVDLGSYSEVYVEYVSSDTDRVQITPDADVIITESTNYNTSIDTYQSAVDSGIINNVETSFTIYVKESNGGTVLDELFVSRLSYNGQSCNPIVTDPGDDKDTDIFQ